MVLEIVQLSQGARVFIEEKKKILSPMLKYQNSKHKKVKT